jgi:hypothetical protein
MRIPFVTIISLFVCSMAFGQNPYYPLKKGTIQIFKYSNTFSTTAEQKAKIEFLPETIEINRDSYFVYEMSLGSEGNYEPVQKTYIKNGDNGSIIGIINTESTEEAVMFPEKPWKVGTTWTSEIMGMSTTGTIIEMAGSIKTPETTFTDCLVIEYDFGESKTISYFQKDVGLVAVSILSEGKEKLVQYLSQ